MGVIKVGDKSQVLSKEVVLVFVYVALTHGPLVEVPHLSPVSKRDVTMCSVKGATHAMKRCLT